MTATQASLGYGSQFQIEEDGDPGTFIPVEETYKVGGPNQKLDTKDASNFLSPNGYKEFIAGMREGGEFTWEGNYLPKETGQLQLNTDFQAGSLKNFRFILPGSPRHVERLRG